MKLPDLRTSLQIPDPTPVPARVVNAPPRAQSKTEEVAASIVRRVIADMETFMRNTDLEPGTIVAFPLQLTSTFLMGCDEGNLWKFITGFLRDWAAHTEIAGWDLQRRRDIFKREEILEVSFILPQRRNFGMPKTTS